MDPLSLLLLLWAAKDGWARPAPSSPARILPKRRPVSPRPRSVVPAIPAELKDTSFPGPRWEIDSPVSPARAKRAAELLPKLWANGEGTGVVDEVESRPTGFLATEADGKKGVSVWRLMPGTVLTSPRTGKPFGMVGPEKKRRPKVAPKAEPPAEPKAEAPVPKRAPVVRGRRDDKPLLVQGSSGPAVVELQKLLGMTGQLGFYGKMTVERVKAFQKAKRLDVDGRTGGETWFALLGPA